MLPFTEDAFTGPVIPLSERPPFTSLTFSRLAPRGTMRSEERRVGEEGRSRGSPYHLKKKERSPKALNPRHAVAEAKLSAAATRSTPRGLTPHRCGTGAAEVCLRGGWIFFFFKQKTAYEMPK